MSKVNKHKVLQEWVQEFLDGNYLYFESANAYPNVRAVVPQVGEYVLHTDILGIKHKAYTFVFVGYEPLDTGTSDTNTTNMEVFDDFNEWCEEQKEKRNFPDFGKNCGDYEIFPLQNMANLATITEDGLAKYMLAVRIEYKEE